MACIDSGGSLWLTLGWLLNFVKSQIPQVSRDPVEGGEGRMVRE